MVLVAYKPHSIYRTLRTNRTSFWACNRQTTPPRWPVDILPLRGEQHDRGGVDHRVVLWALSQTTENRKVETRKPLIFRDPIFGFYLQNPTLRQSPKGAAQ